jgi:hypothetical protein
MTEGPDPPLALPPDLAFRGGGGGAAGQQADDGDCRRGGRSCGRRFQRPRWSAARLTRNLSLPPFQSPRRGGPGRRTFEQATARSTAGTSHRSKHCSNQPSTSSSSPPSVHPLPHLPLDDRRPRKITSRDARRTRAGDTAKPPHSNEKKTHSAVERPTCTEKCSPLPAGSGRPPRQPPPLAQSPPSPPWPSPPPPPPPGGGPGGDFGWRRRRRCFAAALAASSAR